MRGAGRWNEKALLSHASVPKGFVHLKTNGFIPQFGLNRLEGGLRQTQKDLCQCEIIRCLLKTNK